MTWLLIGTLLGSIVTSNRVDEEACRGRLAMLKDKGVEAQCVRAPQSIYYNGSLTLTCSTTSCPTVTTTH